MEQNKVVRITGLLSCCGRYPNVSMAFLVIAVCATIYFVFEYSTNGLNPVYKEDYGDQMYEMTNFKCMELSAGIAFLIIWLACIYLFRKSSIVQQGLEFYFWTLVAVCLIYLAATTVPIYNLQESCAVARAFDRSISPFFCPCLWLCLCCSRYWCNFVSKNNRMQHSINEKIYQSNTVYFYNMCSHNNFFNSKHGCICAVHFL